MSILVEKPQIIHIVSEVLIIGALTYYFHQKNKTIMTVVNELTERVKIQDEIIHKHEQIISQLSNKIDQLILNQVQKQEQFVPPKQNNTKQNKKNKPEVQHLFVEMPNIQIPSSLFFDTQKQVEPSSSKVEEMNEDEPEDNNQNSLETIEEELNEEELDAELADELKDLEEN